jgi:two-component system response regulator AtoC
VSSVMIVDDEKNIRFALKVTLEREGHNVDEAASGPECLEKIGMKPYDVVITDLKMDEMNGLELLKILKERAPEVQVIVITAYGTIDTAVEAMKMGAFEYIAKPFQPDEMVIVVSRALELRGLARKVQSLEAKVKERYKLEGIVGTSPEMQKVFKLVADIARSDSTVLITGESGTGKELVANAIHYNSHRADRAFVTINCAAIPEALQESELFGHRKGSFTGAIRDKKGLFQEAHEGTLFLDEVASASRSTQSKLLRFLQNGEIRRLGDTAPKFADVRLVAATNVELEKAIAQGSFREDLYYRLNVIPIHMPPLRERKEDILLLTHHFRRKYATGCGKTVDFVSPEAQRVLMEHSWPGNVRELENAVEYAVTLADGGLIDIEHLPPLVRSGAQQQHAQTRGGRSRTLSEIERDHIRNVLESCEWNQERAATQLGIGRTTLWRKLRKYNIECPTSR